MSLQVIGPHPFARDEKGQQLTRIGTLFPEWEALYTNPPGVHAWQRLNFIEHVNRERALKSRAPLDSHQEEALCCNSVDLVFESDHVLIRPDPARIELAFAADDLLQAVISKRHVKFLSVADVRVRDAIKRRGEYWRLSSLPKTREAKRRLIFGSKVAIAGLPIYYYNRLTGTRWLTYEEFRNLGALEGRSLKKHLQEIADYALQTNRLGRPEIAFFAVDLRRFGARDFAGVVYDDLSAEELHVRFNQLKSQFRAAVHEAYIRDDALSKAWSERMLTTLFLEGNESETEQVISGLSPEFFLQVEWLPGGRLEEGEFLVDPVFEEAAAQPEDPDLQQLCDPRAKEIILNFTRDYGDLDYINLGRVPESLSLDRPQKEGRRGVYLAEFYLRHQAQPIRRFLRLQKWGVWEHLDEGKDLLQSIMESDEYTDYSMGRRLGCRQLGMNLCRRAMMRRLNEFYFGLNARYHGQLIRTTYFERDYIPGIATDKLPSDRYARPGYASAFAALLGRAAASSLVVGRSLENARPAFDDGDEVVLEGTDGLPADILVADHSGAFTEYELPLEHFAIEYARPINRREVMVPDPVEFAERYLAAFLEQFEHVQEDYRKRRRAFDDLFKHSKYDPAGSFAYRWECVLRRLDKARSEAINAAIREHIRVLNGRKADSVSLARAHPKRSASAT
jgi:hypothetical protein